MQPLPEWLSKNEMYAATIPSNKHSEEESSPNHHRKVEWNDKLEPGEELLIGSRWSSSPHEVHKVFLDIDVEHVYKPSRTPGHGHLILNCNVTTKELEILAEILAQLGINGAGNYRQIINHGQLFLRR
jgi:hypothetical protein